MGHILLAILQNVSNIKCAIINRTNVKKASVFYITVLCMHEFVDGLILLSFRYSILMTAFNYFERVCASEPANTPKK